MSRHEPNPRIAKATLPHDPWRDDHLGRQVHDALSPLRMAQPSDVVWERVAGRIAADMPLADRLPRGVARALALIFGRELLDLRAREARARATGLLGATVMVVISIASVRVIRDSSEHGVSVADAFYAARPFAGLTVHEVAIQPEFNPRPVARALPGGAASERVIRALRGVRAHRAQEFLDRSERTFGLPKHCLEGYRPPLGGRFEDGTCRYAPPSPQPAWVRLTDPPQSL